MTGDPPFVSEPVEPEPGTFDASAMARGEPGRPEAFTWRGRRHQVADVVSEYKESSPEGGSGELYLRRHYYEVTTDAGLTMTLYCERQARSSSAAKRRWYVYTVRDSDAG